MEDSGRAAIHKVVDDWLDGDGERDLLLRHELGDATHEVVRCAPPHDVCATAVASNEPPWPAAVPMAKRTRGRSDAFDALVPENLRDKKAGLNIALIADFNIAGRMTGLARLINSHSIHRARTIVLHDDYLGYDRDIVLDRATEAEQKETMAIVEDADFFHFGRAPTPILGIEWMNRIHSKNALVQYFGSEIRHNGESICDFHDKTGIVGLSAWDYTMLVPRLLFYHVNNFFDAGMVAPVDHEQRPVRICHATTNRSFKRTSVIKTALRRVADATGAEVVVIEGKSYAECLAEKQRCHITVDQISSGIYGLSAIESMAMGHAVLCGMSNFALSYYPGCPVVPFHDEESLTDRIVELVKDVTRRRALGEAGRAFVARTANPIDVLMQHCWIYDLVVNGHRFAGDAGEHLLP